MHYVQIWFGQSPLSRGVISGGRLYTPPTDAGKVPAEVVAAIEAAYKDHYSGAAGTVGEYAYKVLRRIRIWFEDGEWLMDADLGPGGYVSGLPDYHHDYDVGHLYRIQNDIGVYTADGYTEGAVDTDGSVYKWEIIAEHPDGPRLRPWETKPSG